MKKRSMRISLYLFLLIWIFQGNLRAQSFQPDFSFTLELQLPVATQNKAFNGIMQGLVNTEPMIQYTLPNSLSFAIGGKYSFFTVNEFRVSENITGGMHTMGGFVKIGSEKFHSDRFATDIGIKVGYATNLFATTFYEQDPADLNNKLTVGKNRQDFESFYVQPTLGLILTADERNAYRFSIAYNYSTLEFAPTQLGIETNSGYTAEELNKGTGSLLVGFAYTRYLGIPAATN